MRFAWSFVCTLACVAAQEEFTVQTELVRPGAGQASPRDNYYTHFEQSFELRDLGADGLGLPADAAARCHAVTLRLQGREVTLALDWGDATHPSRMHVDRNADGRFGDDESLDVRVLRDGMGTWATEPPVRLKLLGCNYFVVLRREADGRRRGQITGHVDYRLGNFSRNGERFELFLLDQDHDGRFLSGGDWFTCLPVELAIAQPRLGPNEGPLVRATDPMLVGTEAIRLHAGSADGEVRVSFGPAGESLGDYLARRHDGRVREWTAARAATAATFHTDHGFAPGEAAATPIPWRHTASADELLAIARSVERPVVAVFHADWADECRDMDVFVFRREDVAAALRDFTPVRYHVPFDVRQGFRRWVAHVLPAYVFVLPDGRVLKFWRRKGGAIVDPPELVVHEKAFKTPQKFLALLADAKARIAADQIEPPPPPKK